MQKTFEYSQQVNALKVLMILFVIFIHENPTADTSGVVSMLWNKIVVVAVPVFFVISGYFFFRNIETYDIATYKRQLKKRVRSLLIPYLLWNLMPICIYATGNLYSIVFRGKRFDALNEFLYGLWNEGLWHVWWDKVSETMPFDSPLWYVRDLMILCVLSPLLYYAIKKMRHGGVAILAVVYVSDIWSGYTGLSLTGILFFSIGAEFALSGRKISDMSQIAPVFYGLSLLLYLLSMVLENDSLHRAFILISCCSWILLFCQIKVGNKINRYSESVFFVLAIHNIFVLANVGKMLEKVHISPILVYWIAPFVTLIVCITLYYILKAIIPQIMKVVCGGR